jgi:predicted RNase H-like nuclease
MNTAIGIDPSWVLTHPTGICAIESAGDGWTVISTHASVMTVDHISASVATYPGDPAVVAVDAPLWIPNRTGIRDCDREVVSRYIRRKIGVYPCNNTIASRRGWKTVDIRIALQQVGFVEAPAAGPSVYFETYPHPALVNMLDLPFRPEYKKGRIANRRAGLHQLGEQLLAYASANAVTFKDPTVRDATIPPDVNVLNGRELKLAEDRLDAFVCALIAMSWIEFGPPGNEIIGAPGQGMMIFPRPRPAG